MLNSVYWQALRFYGSYNVTVTGITIQNSPQFHLKFDNCEAVQVFNMTVSSPGDSPNTDGIHLQNSIDVSIHHTSLSCGNVFTNSWLADTEMCRPFSISDHLNTPTGDDCISIQTGCSNVHVHDVNCGPGHGISIGGLGKDATKACVSNVTVQNVSMNNTMAGVRIKTWQVNLCKNPIWKKCPFMFLTYCNTFMCVCVCVYPVIENNVGF